MVNLTYRRVLSTHLLCNNNDFTKAISPVCEFPLFHKTDLPHRFKQLEITVTHNIICAKTSFCLLCEICSYFVKKLQEFHRNIFRENCNWSLDNVKSDEFQQNMYNMLFKHSMKNTKFGIFITMQFYYKQQNFIKT